MFVKCCCFCIVPVNKIILNQNVICLSIKWFFHNFVHYQTQNQTISNIWAYLKRLSPFFGKFCPMLFPSLLEIYYTLYKEIAHCPSIMSNPTLQTKLPWSFTPALAHVIIILIRILLFNISSLNLNQFRFSLKSKVIYLILALVEDSHLPTRTLIFWHNFCTLHDI